MTFKHEERQELPREDEQVDTFLLIIIAMLVVAILSIFI